VASVDYLEEQTGLDFYRYGDDTSGVLNWTHDMTPGHYSWVYDETNGAGWEWDNWYVNAQPDQSSYWDKHSSDPEPVFENQQRDPDTPYTWNEIAPFIAYGTDTGSSGYNLLYNGERENLFYNESPRGYAITFNGNPNLDQISQEVGAQYYNFGNAEYFTGNFPGGQAEAAEAWWDNSIQEYNFGVNNYNAGGGKVYNTWLQDPAYVSVNSFEYTLPTYRTATYDNGYYNPPTFRNVEGQTATGKRWTDPLTGKSYVWRDTTHIERPWSPIYGSGSGSSLGAVGQRYNLDENTTYRNHGGQYVHPSKKTGAYSGTGTYDPLTGLMYTGGTTSSYNNYEVYGTYETGFGWIEEGTNNILVKETITHDWNGTEYATSDPSGSHITDLLQQLYGFREEFPVNHPLHGTNQHISQWEQFSDSPLGGLDYTYMTGNPNGGIPVLEGYREGTRYVDPITGLEVNNGQFTGSEYAKAYENWWDSPIFRDPNNLNDRSVFIDPYTQKRYESEGVNFDQESGEFTSYRWIDAETEQQVGNVVDSTMSDPEDLLGAIYGWRGYYSRGEYHNTILFKPMTPDIVNTSNFDTYDVNGNREVGTGLGGSRYGSGHGYTSTFGKDGSMLPDSAPFSIPDFTVDNDYRNMTPFQEYKEMYDAWQTASSAKNRAFAAYSRATNQRDKQERWEAYQGLLDQVETYGTAQYQFLMGNTSAFQAAVAAGMDYQFDLDNDRGDESLFNPRVVEAETAYLAQEGVVIPEFTEGTDIAAAQAEMQAGRSPEGAARNPDFQVTNPTALNLFAEGTDVYGNFIPSDKGNVSQRPEFELDRPELTNEGRTNFTLTDRPQMTDTGRPNLLNTGLTYTRPQMTDTGRPTSTTNPLTQSLYGSGYTDKPFGIDFSGEGNAKPQRPDFIDIVSQPAIPFANLNSNLDIMSRPDPVGTRTDLLSLLSPPEEQTELLAI